MRITKNLKIGLDFGSIGYKITRHWIMAIIFAGFVVIGLHLKKSHWTTLYPGRMTIHLTLVIFNQPMAHVTIIKGVRDGSQK